MTVLLVVEHGRSDEPLEIEKSAILSFKAPTLAPNQAALIAVVEGNRTERRSATALALCSP